MRKLCSFLLIFFICINTFSQVVGSKVSFIAADGKTYTGSVKEISANTYKIKYDGVDFEAWLTRDQFTLTEPASVIPNSVSATTVDVRSVFNFGKKKGWTTAW